MKTYHIETELWLPQPRTEIFGFFANPKNLEQLTPPWLRFEILTPGDVAIANGVFLDYRLRLHGVPIRWRSQISLWEPPERFVDRQVKGPYSLWIHQHIFTERGGGTLVGDRVEYAVPGGRLVQKWLVAPDLRRIFQYRHEILSKRFNPEKQLPS